MSSHGLLSGVLFLLLSLGILFGFSLFFLRDFLNVELVSKLLGVNFSSKNEHNSDYDDGATENDQVVSGRHSRGMNTELEVGPPVETLEDVEKNEHSYDLEPVLHIILVNGLIIRVSGREVGTVFLGLSKCSSLSHLFYSINYFSSYKFGT